MVDENMKKYNDDDVNDVNDANPKQHIFKVVIM